MASHAILDETLPMEPDSDFEYDRHAFQDAPEWTDLFVFLVAVGVGASVGEFLGGLTGLAMDSLVWSVAGGLGAAVLYGRAKRLPLRDFFGVLRPSVGWLVAAPFFGLVFGLGAWLALQGAFEWVGLDSNWLREASRSSNAEGIRIGLAVVAVLPFGEELLFRGAAYRLVERRFGATIAVVVTGVLFALAHGHPALVLGTLVPGLGYAWLRWKSGSVVPGMVAHLANNALIWVVVSAT